MNEKEKQTYLEEYKKEKEKGVFFFPDILFKDAVAGLVVFIILVALAYFIGAPLEERANPSDTAYTPRPEWYFLFLFQLLKYFPGKLEVIGAVIIPTLAMLLLFVLPFLDKSSLRHPAKRLGVILGTVAGLAGILILTVLSVVEAPPPSETVLGDRTALLYTENCSGCHGVSVNIPASTNLHEVIAQGSHGQMPAWNADLTNDQIDALVGFILSPAGNQLFSSYCAECHQATDLVGFSPIELKASIVEGFQYPAHQDLDGTDYATALSTEQRTALLNFLIAPDGKRLYTMNCAQCHGSSIAFAGTQEELEQTIRDGGLHIEMPAWRDRLSDDELQALAGYVMEPAENPDGEALYQANCTACHFDRIPTADSYETALEVITTGGSHETMPIWGEVLTDEQITALVAYTLESTQGDPVAQGQQLYMDNCAGCHGDFGEGGVNPARAGDVIAPISTAEYLSTRDDLTLKEIISQGQPNFGMSPFGLSAGGPLDNTEIDALVAFLRSWEADPPVEFPPEISSDTLSLSGTEIYQSICAQCHGVNADGGIGPSLRSQSFKDANTSESIFTTINEGHEATAMVAWGDILSSDQIQELVDFILTLPVGEEGASDEVSFALTVRPAFDSYCQACHNENSAQGGWIGTTYEDVINSGDNGPAVIAGDVENSLLAQKILGTQTIGGIMPPFQEMPDNIIQAILDWIEAGAPDN